VTGMRAKPDAPSLPAALRDLEFYSKSRRKPRLLDLFCGAGGAALGYHRAGFDVVGVDAVWQPNYPFDFILGDAIEFMDGDWWLSPGEGAPFDVIHASPPCQRWMAAQNFRQDASGHSDLIAPLRPLLVEIGLPYVIENVPGAPLHDPVLVCGSMFDPPLDVKRHRHFEANWPLRAPDWPCRHDLWQPRFPARASKGLRRVISVFGQDSPAPVVREAMGMPWATRLECSQAIPPAYTELIGSQLLAHIAVAA
jgi:DNA (cytosine-5)-methyltransferase 1